MLLLIKQYSVDLSSHLSDLLSESIIDTATKWATNQLATLLSIYNLKSINI